MRTGRSIIIVDDNENELRLNQEIVKNANVYDNILPFSSAKDALNYLQLLENIGKYQDISIPETILLDINMPEINGFEFLEEFKKLKTTTRNLISIYMLSSTLDQNEINSAIRHPLVSDFIPKPLTISKLMSQVCNIKK